MRQWKSFKKRCRSKNKTEDKTEVVAGTKGTEAQDDNSHQGDNTGYTDENVIVV